MITWKILVVFNTLYIVLSIYFKIVRPYKIKVDWKSSKLTIKDKSNKLIFCCEL